MSKDYNIYDLVAQRIGGAQFTHDLNGYKFKKIKDARSELLSKDPTAQIIDLGVGEPDNGADERVVERLYQEALKEENRFYADNGILPFQKAASNFLKSFYGITNIDPQSEVIHGIGTKSILAMLPHCFIDEGDYTLMTVPGYPILGTHTVYVGGRIYNLMLSKDNNYLPNLSSIPTDILGRTKLLYINYPNNPTGQVANHDFYKSVIDFAYKHNIIVVSDAAYGPLVFDTEPISFLQLPGAKEVGVEIHSLSKAFNMTGWRIAFMAGNRDVIKAYGKIKAQSDSGQFIAIQKSGIEALGHRDIIESNCERYNRRHGLLANALRDVGFDVNIPKGTFYIYTPIPKGTSSGIVFDNAEEVANYILCNAHVSTVPWDDAGSYLRFSVTFKAKDLKEEIAIVKEVKKRLSSLNLIF